MWGNRVYFSSPDFTYNQFSYEQGFKPDNVFYFSGIKTADIPDTYKGMHKKWQKK